MEDGPNEIEVYARADDDTQATRTIEVKFDSNAPDRPVPTDLVVQRNRLLEDCLRTIKEVRLEAEERRAEQVRKELMVEIEQERDQARERAADQRKQLDLEVGDETSRDEP